MNLHRLESAEEVGAFLELLPLEWTEELEAWMRRHPGEPDLFGVFGDGDAAMKDAALDDGAGSGIEAAAGAGIQGGRAPELSTARTLLGGGAVFRRSTPPGMTSFRNEASRRLSAGEAYIGFLWVAPEARGRGLGRLWLEELARTSPGDPFWLTVEDAGLIPFYEACGFRLEGAIQGEEGPEWLLSRAPEPPQVSHGLRGLNE
jgi:GNAT superfamily N-acetyltransferase